MGLNSKNHLVAQHSKSGRFFESDGVNAFGIEKGEGEPVLCMHGVPASSFLYRKLVPQLAKKGLKGIAFDFPGMGLSERPTDFDYSWSGLGKWSLAAVDTLRLDKFHLVIHDIGGPIGLEMVALQPDRILSLTILNTMIASVATFKKPFVMRPFGWGILGHWYLRMLHPAIFLQLMYFQGVKNRSLFKYKESEAYVDLLKGDDNGKSFIKIMRSFETTLEKEHLYLDAVRNLPAPKQIIWGGNDTALPYEIYGQQIIDKTGIDRYSTLQGKHFLQEDFSAEIAEKIFELSTLAAGNNG